MGIHINADKGQIAPTVFLPGDPLRAKYIANNFLSDVSQYNNVRNMLGYTGFYHGERISVQSTGMGIPSIQIYAYELINEFSCRNLIRIGTAGSFHERINLGDIVVALTASTDSAFLKKSFPHVNYCPTVSSKLLELYFRKTAESNMALHVGNVFTSDFFYEEEPKIFSDLKNYNCLAVEMEIAGLYTLAAKFDVQAFAMCTVTDQIFENKHMTVEQREVKLDSMIDLALSTFSSV